MSTNPVERQQGFGGGSHQVLTFVLGNETYGVDILRVQEIRGWSAVTKIPHAPSHVLGVLNLRGSIVPIVDLRMRFAVVVDGVSDVVDVNTAEVKPAPELGSRAATDYIRGLVSVSDRMVVLLDIDRLIATDMSSFSGNLTQGEATLVASAA